MNFSKAHVVNVCIIKSKLQLQHAAWGFEKVQLTFDSIKQQSKFPASGSLFWPGFADCLYLIFNTN